MEERKRKKKKEKERKKKKEKKKEKRKERRIMPSLVATTSALARTTCVSTHYVRTIKSTSSMTLAGLLQSTFGL